MVETRSSSGKRETARVAATDEHSVYLPGLRRWVQVGDLSAGDVLRAADSRELIRVKSVTAYVRLARVYDLTVEGPHSYYVKVGGASALVHNCGTASPYELEPTHPVGQTRSSQRNLADIADSMQKNGYKGPSVKVVMHDGGKLLVDGHHRTRAAKMAGIDEVPFEVVDLPFKSYRDMDDVLEGWYSMP